MKSIDPRKLLRPTCRNKVINIYRFCYRRCAHQYWVQGMGAQHPPRQIWETWLGALRTNGGLSPAISVNRQIITATNRVQVGSRKRIEQKEDISLLTCLVGRPRSHPVPSGFLSARRYRSGLALLLLTVIISSAHRLRRTYNDCNSVIHLSCQSPRKGNRKKGREKRERKRERDEKKEK